MTALPGPPDGFPTPGKPLDVVGSGTTTIDNEAGARETIAYLVIDTSRRPDVADIARVHLDEGPGQSHVWWEVADSGRSLVLHCQVLRPAQCRFSVAIPLPVGESVLVAAAKIGAVVVMPNSSTGPTLQLEVRAAEVFGALTQAKHLRA